MIPKKVSVSLAVLPFVTYRQAFELFHTQKLAATFCDSWRKSIFNLGIHNKKKCQSSENAYALPVPELWICKHYRWLRRRTQLKYRIHFSNSIKYDLKAYDLCRHCGILIFCVNFWKKEATLLKTDRTRFFLLILVFQLMFTFFFLSWKLSFYQTFRI